MCFYQSIIVQFCCRSLYGNVDWNILWLANVLVQERRSLYGNVDWNLLNPIEWCLGIGRSLYGNVDWNLAPQHRLPRICWSFPVWERGLKYNTYRLQPTAACVVPCMGTWIEIAITEHISMEAVVVPCMGLGGGAAHTAGIYSAADRVSNKVWEADEKQ